MRSAFTLLEIVVALALFSLLVLLGLQLTRPLALVSKRTMARLEMQHQALIALGQIRSCMQASAPEGISVRSGVIAINPRDNPAADSSGNLRWTPQITAFYLISADSSLRKRQWPGAGDSPPAWMSSVVRPKKLDGPLLMSLANPLSRANIVARGVVSLEVINAGPDGSLHQPLKVQLVLQRDMRQMTFLRSVFLVGSS